MRKPRVKWFLFVLALLAVVIGIPVIINESYKANSGYMTMWGAADALAYYGTILGSLVAVATVVVTILFTYKQIQRDSYLRRENEKWFDVESVFSNALNTINLMPPLIETMRFKMYSMQTYLATLGIDYDALTKDEFISLIGILKKSKHMKSPISQRGKTTMTHGKGKRKKR